MGVGCLSPPIETSHPLPVPPGQPFPVTLLRGTPEWVLVVGGHRGPALWRPQALRCRVRALVRFSSAPVLEI